MDNIICVDLTKLNDIELNEFCTINEFSYDRLLDFKNKTYAKIWLTKDGVCIAFNLIKENEFLIDDYETIRLFNKFLLELEPIKPYEPKKQHIVLEVDVILEKIFKYGEDILTTEEKNFLDNQQKYCEN